MKLLNTIGIAEIIVLGLFILLYALYFLRLVKVSKQVQSKHHIWKKLFLRSLYFPLMLIALLGPSFGELKKEVKAVGKDIYLLVDLSKSMDAEDIQPSRLNKAKFELKKIIKEFNSDRLGLIVFSGEAFLQCPLTYDQNALTMFLETINTNLVSASGTDFYPPLRMARNKLEEKEDEPAKNQQQSKVVILVSDGEDFGEETVDIAKKMKDEGIKVFTLGMGTRTGAKIPYRGRFKTDNRGREVITQLNDEAMKDLADLTGGKYFEISDKKNDIERLISNIERIEGEFKSSKQVDVKANKYIYFLGLALILFIGDVFYSSKVIKI